MPLWLRRWPAVHDAHADARLAHVQHHEVDQPVIHEHAVADTHIIGQRVIRDGDLSRTHAILGHQHDVGAGHEIDGRRQVAHPDARPLQIAEDGHGTIELARQAAHGRDRLGMLVVRAV